jgi:undecaprenyl diphosphate synthase
VGKKEEITLPAGTKVPDHVAIIMDGNRRWARANGLDTLEGHKAGFDRAITIGRAARQMGIHTVSLWGFSTENWEREKRELDYLMMLYKRMLDRYLKEAMKDGVRLIHLGRKDRLPKDLIEQIADAEEKTRHFYKHIVNICLDHGGKDEILRAVNRIISEKVSVGQLDEKAFEKYLDTADQPYPHVDLLIRTSGEQRTSGFLLWQAAYAEVYWELDHLPDFTPEKFSNAIIDYSRRRRRFGANDKEEHVKFDPKLVANFEVGFRRELKNGENSRFRDFVMKYVKEQYGMTKELAKEAGLSLAEALIHHKQGELIKAKKALVGLYDLVKKNLGLAFEPEFVANLELNLWNGKTGVDSEQKMREWYSEAWRFSDFQATKAAHLAVLAKSEMANERWEKANWYLERSYVALKERVA